MVDKALFSSSSDDWCTPDHLLEYLCNTYGYLNDPCPHYFFDIICQEFCAPFNALEIDGLLCDWQERNFVNPPYSEIKKWVEKAYHEYMRGKYIILLIPARMDTAYTHDYLLTTCQSIIFIRGRLHFNNSKNSAPFPSMLCIFDPALKTERPNIESLSLRVG